MRAPKPSRCDRLCQKAGHPSKSPGQNALFSSRDDLARRPRYKRQGPQEQGRAFAMQYLRSAFSGFIFLLCLGLLASPGLARIESFQLSAADDNHELVRLDRFTWVIAEIGSAPRNIAHVLVGKERALLLDSGSGRHITKIVTAATLAPVTVLPTHLHAVHLGGAKHYENLSLVDLPWLRERATAAENGVSYFTPTISQSMSLWAPTLKVTNWVSPDTSLDLGERSLRVLHTPGHTEESISVYDEDTKTIYTGGLLHGGDVKLYQPGASVADALASVQKLRRAFPNAQTIRGSRGMSALPATALLKMEKLLEDILAGKASGARVWSLAGLVRRYEAEGFALLAP